MSSTPEADSQRPVALITGAARRIGRAIALELAAQGWALALHHRQSGEQAQALAAELARGGTQVHLLSADLSDESQTRSLAGGVVRAFGRWDAVVNNASLFEYDDIASFSYEALQRHLCANTAAPVLLAQCLHAHLQGRPGARGCVVNLLDLHPVQSGAGIGQHRAGPGAGAHGQGVWCRTRGHLGVGADERTGL
jgi:NAD(P)-dependent dehydrogenase (short-subunit alcohol dehydrogenase family)